jgi:hypothetical protein
MVNLDLPYWVFATHARLSRRGNKQISRKSPWVGCKRQSLHTLVSIFSTGKIKHQMHAINRTYTTRKYSTTMEKVVYLFAQPRQYQEIPKPDAMSIQAILKAARKSLFYINYFASYLPSNVFLRICICCNTAFLLHPPVDVRCSTLRW